MGGQHRKFVDHTVRDIITFMVIAAAALLSMAWLVLAIGLHDTSAPVPHQIVRCYPGVPPPPGQPNVPNCITQLPSTPHATRS